MYSEESDVIFFRCSSGCRPHERHCRFKGSVTFETKLPTIQTRHTIIVRPIWPHFVANLATLCGRNGHTLLPKWPHMEVERDSARCIFLSILNNFFTKSRPEARGSGRTARNTRPACGAGGPPAIAANAPKAAARTGMRRRRATGAAARKPGAAVRHIQSPKK